MSECAKEIEWAGGKHVFDLGDPRLRAVLSGERERHLFRTRRGVRALEPLHGQFGSTPAACLKRFEDAVYSQADVERVMLYGLWGGGKTFVDADDLVEEFVRSKPIAPNALVAMTVLAAVFVGAE